MDIWGLGSRHMQVSPFQEIRVQRDGALRTSKGQEGSWWSVPGENPSNQGLRRPLRKTDERWQQMEVWGADARGFHPKAGTFGMLGTRRQH